MNTRSTGAMDQVPTGEQAPLVMVVGMPRSGTSAVAGSIVALGIPTAEDISKGNVYNPKGYFESEALSDYCTVLLDYFGGSWFIPPNISEEFYSSDALSTVIGGCRLAFESALPSGPALWKEPRATSLLPIWRLGTDRPLGMVLVWRDPAEVALSLWKGIRMDIPLGIALWSDYNRRAIEGIRGLPAFVCSYEHAISSPEYFVEGIIGLMTELGHPEFGLNSSQRREAESFFEKRLRRETALNPASEYAELARSVGSLTAYLNSIEGLHPQFDVHEPPASPDWAHDLLVRLKNESDLFRASVESSRAGRASEMLLEIDSNEATFNYQAVRQARANISQARLANFDLTASVDGSVQFSLVAAIWRTQPEEFSRFLSTFLGQTWRSAELCICDDASGDATTSVKLQVASSMENVRLMLHDTPRGLNEAARSAYRLATGEFVAFISQSDSLAPWALESFAAAIELEPEGDVFYSDEDKMDIEGTPFAPDLKPDWSPDLLESEPYMGRLLFVRRRLLDEVGGVGDSYPDDGGYDIMLRATEAARKVVHVTDVLYHWSWAGVPQENRPPRLPWCHEAMRRSLESALKRRSEAAIVSGEGSGQVKIEAGPFATTFHVRRSIDTDATVSVVVLVHPNEGSFEGISTALRRCLNSLKRSSGERVTQYFIAVPESFQSGLMMSTESIIGKNLAQVVYSNGSFPHFSQGELGTSRDEATNTLWSQMYGAANLAVRETSARFVCFVHCDIAVDAGWLAPMLEQGCRPQIGIVGARIVTPQGNIQHSGIALASQGPMWISGALDGQLPSALRTAGLIHNSLGVSAACMLIDSDLFELLGGFDTSMGGRSDIDLCMRATASSPRRVVVTPLAEVVHYGQVSEGLLSTDNETERWNDKWGSPIDPFLPSGLDPADPCLSRIMSLEQLGYRVLPPEEEGGGFMIAPLGVS
ncbi:MAG TPA: glycosyltransferase [Acidimicrobiales bacterium]|nr:glycosyltransferase [Acidimicrobiales bacterium]